MPRHSSFTNKLTAIRLRSVPSIKRRILRLSLVRLTLFLILLAALGYSFSGRHSLTTTAQEPGKRTISEAAGLQEARAAGMIERPAVGAIEDAPSLSPEGGACNWAAGTVYSVPILDQATVTHAGNIYTFGGVSNNVIVASSFKFDGTTWTPIAPLPVALEFPSAVSNGTFIYILGGALVGTGVPQTTVFRYDTVANSYTPMAPFTNGTWNHASAYLNGKIYKFAGTGPGTASTNVLEIYDVTGNSWTVGAPYPIMESFVGTFVDANFIYGAGGISSPSNLATLKTYRYDPVANSWDDAAIADLPLTRWGAASSLTAYGSNNGWVLAGGYENGTLTANISSTAVRWNPTSNTWASLPNVGAAGTERSRLGGAILGSSFYAIGGRSIASAGFVGTNSNNRLTCVSGVAVVNANPPTIIAESCGTPNGAPDPGENLGVSLFLSNIGDTATTNLTVTLQATGGVTNAPPPQVYGAVLPGAPAVEEIFNFTVDPNLVCGAPLSLTFVVNDGATNYPNVTRQFLSGVQSVTLAENFDGVTAPALPAGWTTVQLVGTAINWVTSTTTPNSVPNAAFANDPSTANLSALISPAVVIQSTDSQITFRNNFLTENTFDGMVLEFTTNGGSSWTDIITGGGSFVSGGYTGVLATGDSNPLPARNAWTGNSNGYITTLINLPASLNGQTVQFRWLMGSDALVASTGVRVDNVQILGPRVCNTCLVPGNARADFDGDGKTDISVFRGGTTWFINRSTAGFLAQSFGASGDIAVPNDYEGDGKTDIAVFRSGTWFVLRSSDNVISVQPWGTTGDIPQAGDYDGDAKADYAVYRPSTNRWFVKYSSGIPDKNLPWGIGGDIPLVGDFDGDSRADFTVFRPSTGIWHTVSSATPAVYTATSFGLSGDAPAPADYDGDNKTDLAVFRSGTWHILKSTGGVTNQPWGIAGDIPSPGDYDGDGKDDIAVFRSGSWYVLGSTSGPTFHSFGLAGDVSVPARYVP